MCFKKQRLCPTVTRSTYIDGQTQNTTFVLPKRLNETPLFAKHRYFFFQNTTLFAKHHYFCQSTAIFKTL
jgi:hypothetical protein